jgi:hypothetical protein
MIGLGRGGHDILDGARVGIPNQELVSLAASGARDSGVDVGEI